MKQFEVTIVPCPEDQEITGLAEGKRKLALPDDESIPLFIDGWCFADWRCCGSAQGLVVFLHDTDPKQVEEVHETTVAFDYGQAVVRIYTTRLDVKNGIERPMGKEVFKPVTPENNAWKTRIPIAECRNPALLVPIAEESDLKEREFPVGSFTKGGEP